MAAVTREDKPGRTYLATWTLTTADPTGGALELPGASDRSIQVLGTFGGATIAVEGSNDGGTTWAALHDPGGNAVTFTAAGINAISENVLKIRTRLSTVGVGATINAYLLSRSTK